MPNHEQPNPESLSNKTQSLESALTPDQQSYYDKLASELITLTDGRGIKDDQYIESLPIETQRRITLLTETMAKVLRKEIEREPEEHKEREPNELKTREDVIKWAGEEVKVSNSHSQQWVDDRFTFEDDKVIAKGGLYLNNCTSLTKLPDNLEVRTSLYLKGCTALTKLPDNLKVGESLFLERCTSLTKLPDSLKVGTDLYLPLPLKEMKEKKPEMLQQAIELKKKGRIGGDLYDLTGIQIPIP